MIHLLKHVDQLDATTHSILNPPDEWLRDMERIIGDIRDHLHGKTLVDEGLTEQDPAGGPHPPTPPVDEPTGTTQPDSTDPAVPTQVSVPAPDPTQPQA